MNEFPLMPPVEDVTVENMPADVKERINAALYYCLPGKTTLQRMEQIACHMHDIVAQEWNKP